MKNYSYKNIFYFKGMYKSSLMTSYMLDNIDFYVNIGSSTININSICHKEILKFNGFPATLGYNGFSKSLCTSENNIVCHGVPNRKKIKFSDIFNIDITIKFNSYHGDSSRMYNINKNTIFFFRRVIEVSLESLVRSLILININKYFNEIGRIINNYVNKFNFSSVREYCGHGIGKYFHSLPNILHYYNNSKHYISEGMFFTIEPMINEDSWKTKSISKWIVETNDNKLSSQFEHTVSLICKKIFVMTKSLKKNYLYYL